MVKGYEATSQPYLHEAMGLSRSSLFETFGEKKSLYLETLDRYASETRARREGIFASAPTASAVLRA